jgi:hypothetical protein
MLYLEYINPSWYAPVYGFLFSCLALILFAALRIHFATVRGANMNVYELLKICHSELKARLGLDEISDQVRSEGHSHEKQALDAMQDAFNVKSDDYYSMEALRKAYEAYNDLEELLIHNHSGIEWVFETGYIYAWRNVHRAQEALISVETDQEVISDVIHDVRTIQNSPFGDSTALITKMLQAVKDINPEAMAYFEEFKSDKNYADLFDPPHKLASVMELSDKLVNFLSMKKPKQPAGSNKMAREVIRQIRHTLNLYQDHLRETLVRLRNHVLIAIALTGFVTYLLVCNIILWHAHVLSIKTATAYYLIGVIGGLFVRFYNESNNKDSPEDYGLFVSRLVATPLLSGLAGIGGVLVTATISTLGSAHLLATIFNYPPNLDYLIAATLFGSAPNLIIGSLQQRAQKYTTQLQNSKGEGKGEGSNKDE